MKNLKKILIGIKIKVLEIIWRIKYTLFKNSLPKNSDGKVYLNLGCGVNTSKEYINIDAIPFKHTHLIANIQDLSMFPNNSIDLVYASHVVEHIPRGKIEKTFKEWHRVLKPGGILRFGVPNFDSLIEIYNLSQKNTDSIVNQLLGQDGEYDDHHTIWNFNTAKLILENTGFKNISPWDPTTVELHKFNDKTNRKTTIGDKEISISLNVQGVK